LYDALLAIRRVAGCSPNSPNMIDVIREDVLESASPTFLRATFRENSPLSVRFIDEPGIDAGGLRREFMTLALQQLASSPMFSGPDDQKMLRRDATGNCSFSFIENSEAFLK
jgi:hypothetical protein